MANYYDPNKYSLLKEMQHNTQYSNVTPQQAIEDAQPMFDKDTSKAMASGMQSGGVSGALMSGGIMTSNPFMIGGGLLLSELEAQKKAEAEAERQNIENEKNRRKNIQSVLGQMSTTKFGV